MRPGMKMNVGGSGRIHCQGPCPGLVPEGQKRPGVDPAQSHVYGVCGTAPLMLSAFRFPTDFRREPKRNEATSVTPLSTRAAPEKSARRLKVVGTTQQSIPAARA